VERMNGEDEQKLDGRLVLGSTWRLAIMKARRDITRGGVMMEVPDGEVTFGWRWPEFYCCMLTSSGYDSLILSVSWSCKSRCFILLLLLLGFFISTSVIDTYSRPDKSQCPVQRELDRPNRLHRI
jgi:hypothetical protein